MKLTFSDLKLENGRSRPAVKQTALADDLTSLLLGDDKSKEMIRN